MRIKINRYQKSNESLLGELSLDGTRTCLTLEWITRPDKLPGKTGIPVGRYRILPRREGTIYRLYTSRIEQDHPIIWLQDVPEFRYVYIHIGNHLSDTEGCILVGSSSEIDADGNFVLRESFAAYSRLHRSVSIAWNNGDEVWLEVGESYEK